MYAALRTCWKPPPKDSARHGMEYTVRFALKRDGEIMAPPRVTYSSHDAPAGVREVYRDAVNAALGRCTPLHLSQRMGRAVAGRPIAIRFVDNRTIDDGKSLQSPQRVSLRRHSRFGVNILAKSDATNTSANSYPWSGEYAAAAAYFESNGSLSRDASELRRAQSERTILPKCALAHMCAKAASASVNG